MAKRLYVGNLPFTTNDAELQETFAQAGTVTSAQVIVDRQTGRSKGFGFVEMSTDEESQAAIDMFNGKEYGGRNLVVNEARPPEQRAPRSGGFGGGRGGYGGGHGGGFGGGSRY